MDLHPTGTCFDDAAKIFATVLLQFGSEQVRLVHGIGQASRDLKVISHAWVEVTEADGRVWALTEGLVAGKRKKVRVNRDRFYEMFGVNGDVTRYTVEETLVLDKRHGYCGPWEPRYLALTRDGGRDAG